MHLYVYSTHLMFYSKPIFGIICTFIWDYSFMCDYNNNNLILDFCLTFMIFSTAFIFLYLDKRLEGKDQHISAAQNYHFLRVWMLVAIEEDTAQ